MDQRTWVEEDMFVMQRGWMVRHTSEVIEYVKLIPEYGYVVILATGKDISPCSVSICFNGRSTELLTINFDSSLWLAWDLCGRVEGLLENHLESQLELPNNSLLSRRL